MSKTALQIVNSVLTRLREDTVTDFSDSYTQLILEFVNETLREVQSKHQWDILRKEVDFLTEDGVYSYILSGTTDDVVGDVVSGGNVVNEYSSLVFTNYMGDQQPSAWIFPGNSVLSGVGERLTLLYKEKGRSVRYMTTASGTPKHFYVSNTLNSSNVTTVSFRFIEPPSDDQLVKMVWYIPTDDVTDTTDIIQVPHNPIILGAYAKALDERGEELGPQVGFAIQKYQQALDDAIMLDMGDETIIAVPE